MPVARSFRGRSACSIRFAAQLALLIFAQVVQSARAQVPTGSCCTSDGCVVLSRAACGALGGDYLGDHPNSDCFSAGLNCDVLMRPCCLPDGQCTSLLISQCNSQRGVWAPTVNCALGECNTELGACFGFLTFTCFVSTAHECAAMSPFGSDWYRGQDCTLNLEAGACCIPMVGCGTTIEIDCAARNGVFAGSNVDCSRVNAMTCQPLPTGACCIVGGECVVVPSSECSSGFNGVYRGDGTTCSATACSDVLGACCYAFGCYRTVQPDCAQNGGAFHGIGSDCLTALCPFPTTGLCCLGPSGCSTAARGPCELIGGTFYGYGLDCIDPLFDCLDPPVAGACCRVDGSCEFVTEDTCFAFFGMFAGIGTSCGGSCTPTGGGCCVSGACTIAVSQAACTAQGGSFRGIGSDCSAGFPCPGDMNADRRIDGDDIQSFVTCHISLSPAAPPCSKADINGNGGFDADDVSQFVRLLLEGFVCCP